MTPRGALVLATLANIAPVEIGVRPGSELSFHASAQGKVLLAFAPRALQERILSRPRPTFTTKTIIGAAEVENELLRIREAGHASAPEQTLLGVNAVAAPIFDETDSCIGAVAVVGSIQFLPEVPEAHTLLAVKHTGQQISRKLGHGKAAAASLATGDSRYTRLEVG